MAENSNGVSTSLAEPLEPVSHVFGLAISGSGSNALSEPSDVEVDQTSHDVYVTDPPEHRVEKFSPTGEFILMFGKEVDQSTGGDVCTAASGDICKAGASAASPGGFEQPTYLAVDSPVAMSTSPTPATTLYLSLTHQARSLRAGVREVRRTDPMRQTCRSSARLAAS